jgi:glycosyltransferase involved in cell wall biosynthesis
MRVLQVHNRQLATGGVDYVIANDRRMLESSGHDVDQLFLVTGDALEDTSPARAGMKAIWNGAFARELAAKIDAFRPDVMHVHTPFPLMSPVVFRVGAKAGVPTVATVHSFRYSCITGLLYRDGRVCELCVGGKLKLAGVRHRCYHDSFLGSSALTAGLALHGGIGTFRSVDVWIAPSEFMRAKLVQEGIPAAKVVVNPNSTPDPGIRHGTERGNALFLGRLEPEKGVDVLLEAWQAMEQPPPLTIAGTGTMSDAVARAAATTPAITFAGWLDRDAATEALRSARFLILPSEWYEAGMPLSAIEALAVGTPVIASDVGNFSEMVRPGANGFLFRSGSAESLAQVVAQAWDTADGSLAESARSQYLAEHSEERNAERLLAAYGQAMGARRRQAA